MHVQMNLYANNVFRYIVIGTKYRRARRRGACSCLQLDTKLSCCPTFSGIESLSKSEMRSISFSFPKLNPEWHSDSLAKIAQSTTGVYDTDITIEFRYGFPVVFNFYLEPFC